MRSSDCKNNKLEKRPLETKEDIKIVDVSDGVPQSIVVIKNLTLILKGKNNNEKIFNLTPGTWLVNEVIKNIFTTNGRGGFEKVGKQTFLVAERTR